MNPETALKRTVCRFCGQERECYVRVECHMIHCSSGHNPGICGECADDAKRALTPIPPLAPAVT